MAEAIAGELGRSKDPVGVGKFPHDAFCPSDLTGSILLPLRRSLHAVKSCGRQSLIAWLQNSLPRTNFLSSWELHKDLISLY